MNIIILGPPGSGKGTQADNLVKEFNLYKVSTGDLLRDEVKKNTELGEKIKTLIDKGSFVSDDLTYNLIEKIFLKTNSSSKFIFDGYPRNINQVKNLEIILKKYEQKISCVFSFTLNKKTIVDRILSRLVCAKCGLTFNRLFNKSTKEKHDCGDNFLQKRSDDNEETILKRIKTYNNETLPILEYYRKLNLLHEIDVKGEIKDIYKEICRIMRSLET